MLSKVSITSDEHTFFCHLVSGSSSKVKVGVTSLVNQCSLCSRYLQNYNRVISSIHNIRYMIKAVYSRRLQWTVLNVIIRGFHDDISYRRFMQNKSIFGSDLYEVCCAPDGGSRLTP